MTSLAWFAVCIAFGVFIGWNTTWWVGIIVFFGMFLALYVFLFSRVD